jgi:hypothetical protein
MTSIKSASYLTKDSHHSGKVRYYDSEGNFLTSFDQEDKICPLDRLDPTAPKFKPHTCELHYKPEFVSGFGWTSGASGWFIIFRNRLGCEIKRLSYNRSKKQISYYSNSREKTFKYDFDLSKPLLESQFKHFDLSETQVIGDINPPEPAKDGLSSCVIC